MEIDLLWMIMGGIFVIGYVAIALEHNLKINKSGTAIVMGAVLWVLVSLLWQGGHDAGSALMHETQEIFSIVVFLLAAMTIVEILVHYCFFDWVEEQLMKKRLSQGALFWILGGLAFVFSAFLDNLTSTLVMIQIGRKIYKDRSNFLIFTANTVIAANAGGAASPVGDVTTIMLWLAEKFTAWEIIIMGILPAIAAWVVPQYFMGKKIKAHEEAEKAHDDIETVEEEGRTKPYWPVIIIGMLSFTLPVVSNLIDLPPFLGLLLGVGVLWIFINLKSKNGGPCHGGRVSQLVQKTDIATLKFFIGILLAVGALAHVGILKELNDLIFGADPSVMRLAFGNIALGMISSVLDNVPLVAAAIKMFADGLPVYIWVLLAITAGTGGSMLVVGSAAGVAAMGQVKGLTFGYYFRKAAFPALLGYIAAVAVWFALLPVFDIDASEIKNGIADVNKDHSEIIEDHSSGENH